jgi:hypothetical protein
MSARGIEEWRREVFRSKSPAMTPAVKVLCLYLADHARGKDLRISVPRERMAKDLGIHKARVAERLAKASEAGFLFSVSKGYLGHTAVYRALFPDPACVPLHRTHMRPVTPDAYRTAPQDAYPADAERESRSMDTAPQDAITTADLSGTTADRNVGGNERAVPASVVSSVRRAATHDREASA